MVAAVSANAAGVSGPFAARQHHPVAVCAGPAAAAGVKRTATGPVRLIQAPLKKRLPLAATTVPVRPALAPNANPRRAPAVRHKSSAGPAGIFFKKTALKPSASGPVTGEKTRVFKDPEIADEATRKLYSALHPPKSVEEKKRGELMEENKRVWADKLGKRHKKLEHVQSMFARGGSR
jgi:hypothetical protein